MAHNRNSSHDKPGSDPKSLKNIGGKNDFGAKADDRIDREYVSKNTKAADPGTAHPHAGTQSRTAGVGSNDTGVGSGSGGDLDTDIIGIGSGSGIAASGKVKSPPGPDDSDGTSNEFASGPPAKGEVPRSTGKIGGKSRVEGSTVDRSGGDVETTASGRGADAATGAEQFGDDSFKGEISTDEATGQSSQ